MERITEIPRPAERPKDSHKGDFGRILIVGGSVGMSGSPAISGMAALRCGAGCVRVAVPQGILPIVACLEPCYTTIPLPQDDTGCMSAAAAGIVLNASQENDVVAFGPGAGTAPGVKDVLTALIESKDLRIVIDADGLNCLAKTTGWSERNKTSAIITPHPGEMKRLWMSFFRHEPPADRTEQAVKLAQRCGCTVVLKGAGTVVTDGSRFYINTTGNPGMATAGAGDVLTGVIAAFAGQGLNDFDAAVAGVYIHGRAGDIAAGKKGQLSLTAMDIVASLCEAFIDY